MRQDFVGVFGKCRMNSPIGSWASLSDSPPKKPSLCGGYFSSDPWRVPIPTEKDLCYSGAMNVAQRDGAIGVNSSALEPVFAETQFFESQVLRVFRLLYPFPIYLHLHTHIPLQSPCSQWSINSNSFDISRANLR